MPLVDRSDQRVQRVHRRPRRRCLEDLAGGVVLDLLLGPRIGQHRGGVVCPIERERVESRGHRGTNPATAHRQSKGSDPLVHKGFRHCDPTVTWRPPGRVRVSAAVISTGSIGGGPAGACVAVISTGSIGGGPAGACVAVISTGSIGGGPAGACVAVISTGSIGGGPVGAFAAVISTSSISGGRAGACVAVISTGSISGGPAGAFNAEVETTGIISTSSRSRWGRRSAAVPACACRRARRDQCVLLLTQRRGWTSARYAAWLESSLLHGLLAQDAS